MSWTIGTGSKIHCWKDNWVPNIGSLLEQMKESNNLDPNTKLKDMVTNNETWNLEAFRETLTEDTMQKISGFIPPHPLDGPDIVHWSHASNGQFSIKSAYGKITRITWNARDTRWKDVLKYQGPQRVGFFLWLICKQRLLTNSERVRRGIGQNTVCSICQHHLEDTLHVLQDCPATKEMWMQLIPINWRPQTETPWGSLFGLIAWRLWKNRNFFVFQDLAWNITETIETSLCWARQFIATQKWDPINPLL